MTYETLKFLALICWCPKIHSVIIRYGTSPYGAFIYRSLSIVIQIMNIKTTFFKNFLTITTLLRKFLQHTIIIII